MKEQERQQEDPVQRLTVSDRCNFSLLSFIPGLVQELK